MGRLPATQATRKRKVRQADDARMSEAIADWNQQKATLLSGNPSIRAIARTHHVDHVTLWRRVKGGLAMSDFNALKRHMTRAEEGAFVAWIVEQGLRGFPATHRIVKERANAILQVRLGPKFSVGKAWLSRFLDRYKGVLSQYWAKPLDRTRMNGLNPVAVSWYFDALERAEQTRGPIPRENWYAGDETGLALGLAGKSRVIAGAGKPIQHMAQDGEREIVTVLETICADGTVLKPAVVFKGKNILKKWGMDNPCEAMIGVGPKGYMDGELAVKWLSEFHEQTKHKNDLPRVLLVDGHASHCTLKFLDLADSLGIIVISYPPHTTHRLQGLDVVIFAVLKHHWQLLREMRERANSLPVKKEDFLAILSCARAATYTPELIKQAFRKTGAYPIDRTVVKPEEMVPSQESSNQITFPAALASPVKAILAANRVPIPTPAHSPAPSTTNSALVTPSGTTDTPNLFFNPADITPEARAKAANFLLEKTSASFLVNKDAVLTEDTSIPPPIFERPDKALNPDWSLLTRTVPKDAKGLRSLCLDLLASFGRSKAHGDVLESCLEASNAQLVLAHMEIARLKGALRDLTEKGKKKNTRAKLMSSEKARMVTSPEFRAVLEEELEKARVKEQKKKQTKDKRSVTKRVEDWRKKAIAEKKVARAKQLEEYEEAKRLAKEMGEKVPKPPKAVKRPKTPPLSFFQTDDVDDEEEEVAGVSEDDEDEDGWESDEI